MKTYPYNRYSSEGRAIYSQLDQQYNVGQIEPDLVDLENHTGEKAFERMSTSAILKCRVNDMKFLIDSNIREIQRPRIYLEADVEMAWGEFGPKARVLDFTHGQELPMTFIQPLEDSTMKSLIDAGLYTDPRFEELMTKLMADEVFDVEADMDFDFMDLSNVSSLVASGNKRSHVPAIFVDPVHVVHDEIVDSEYTSVTTLVNNSAALVVELRKEGVETEEVVQTPEVEVDAERYFSDFEDSLSKATDTIVDTTPKATVDEELDITDKMADAITFDGVSEDDIIRDLKERERSESLDAVKTDQEYDRVDLGGSNAGSLFDLNTELGDTVESSNDFDFDFDFDGEDSPQKEDEELER